MTEWRRTDRRLVALSHRTLRRLTVLLRCGWVVLTIPPMLGHAADGDRDTIPSRLSTPVGKVARYLDAVFAERDQDGDGRLNKSEWRPMSGDPQAVDRDRDGSISKSEFEFHIMTYGRARSPAHQSQAIETVQSPGLPVDSDSAFSSDGSTSAAPYSEPAAEATNATSSNPAPRTTRFTVRPSRGLGNLPGWFLSRDADGDGQLTLREFVSESADNSREFDRLDRNGDGVVTPREATAPREPDRTISR